eukprot:90028-Rhodomonas_salina.1
MCIRDSLRGLRQAALPSINVSIAPQNARTASINGRTAATNASIGAINSANAAEGGGFIFSQNSSIPSKIGKHFRRKWQACLQICTNASKISSTVGINSTGVRTNGGCSPATDRAVPSSSSRSRDRAVVLQWDEGKDEEDEEKDEEKDEEGEGEGERE